MARAHGVLPLGVGPGAFGAPGARGRMGWGAQVPQEEGSRVPGLSRWPLLVAGGQALAAVAGDGC